MELLTLPFVQRMLLAGALVSLVCGVIGTFVVVRRIVFISGGIAHTTFGGIGLAYVLQDRLGWSWCEPTLGAAAAAVIAALLLGTPWIRSRLREDSMIGAIWVVGMAAGVLLLGLVDRSHVLVVDPLSILFGNILLVEARDLVVTGALVAVVLLVVLVQFKDLHLLTFDEELARLSGIRVAALHRLLLVLVALTVVVMIKVVGVVLVIAMLTMPAATAGMFTRGVRSMMAAAVAVALVTTGGGILLSLALDTPPGATIVLLLSAVFAAGLGGRALLRPHRA